MGKCQILLTYNYAVHLNSGLLTSLEHELKKKEAMDLSYLGFTVRKTLLQYPLLLLILFLSKSGLRSCRATWILLEREVLGSSDPKQFVLTSFLRLWTTLNI